MEEILAERYRLIKKLGEGGFGYTYLAEDVHRPTPVKCVVKYLKHDLHNPQAVNTAKRLFFSEAEALEALGTHDNIPRLLAYFSENDGFYLVQDFIDGHPVSDELPPGRRWTSNQVLRFLLEVLEVLEFVHSRGVIHRDIKPDNLIRQKQSNRLFLVDFGAVKQARRGISLDTRFTDTVSIGTPGYMPTEQSRGNPRKNSDIYSLGIIAVQALTGLTIQQLLEEPTTGEFIWRPYSEASQQFLDVIERMVRYHFKERYQSATEVIKELKNLDIYQSNQTAILPSVSNRKSYVSQGIGSNSSKTVIQSKSTGSGSPSPSTFARENSPSGFFESSKMWIPRSSFFGEESKRYQKIDETLNFYVGHLDKEYKALSRQADIIFKLWFVCVCIGILILVVGLIMTFTGMIAQGVLTTASTGIVYFIQRIFQQREDYYRQKAAMKSKHLEYGNHWLIIIQSIDAIEDMSERKKQQSKLVKALTKKLRPQKNGEDEIPSSKRSKKKKKKK